MPFSNDPTAPRMEENYEPLDREDVAAILRDSELICESVEDNDVERWLLTKGGQFVRNTGMDSDRFYVVPPEEAFGILNGWVEDDVIAEVHATGAFRDIPLAPSP